MGFPEEARLLSRLESAAGGLGVGLAITKEIVDQHNGKITIESELGKGTTFSLRIPLVRTKG